METVTSNLYEGMFLIDAARAGSDWDGVISAIKKILERAEAEIVSIRKWDDRRLAYDIKSQSRGVYILCYFRIDGEKIRDIEKNVQLSEQIMRVLILNAEHLTEEDIEKDTPAAKAEKEEQGTVEETPAQETQEHQSTDKDSPEERITDQDAETGDTEQKAEEEQETDQDAETKGTEQKAEEEQETDQDAETGDTEQKAEEEQETGQDAETKDTEQEPEEKIKGSESSESGVIAGD